jgi:hypothetical protein
MIKKSRYFLFAVGVIFFWNQTASSQMTNNPHPVPNERQLAWQEAELGALFSYDLHVFDGKKYIQSRNRTDPIPDHQIFSPKHLDPDGLLPEPDVQQFEPVLTQRVRLVIPEATALPQIKKFSILFVDKREK